MLICVVYCSKPDYSWRCFHSFKIVIVLVSEVLWHFFTLNLKLMQCCVGILAKKAVKAGLTVKPFIKTSLSPGSGVVTYYLKESGVLEFLEKLGWVSANHIVVS